jgi:beta-phosphoglucomutase
LAALDIVMLEGGIALGPDAAAAAAARKNSYYQESISNVDESALLPGAAESLEKLKSAGMGIALASASRNARAILRSTRIEPMFDAIIDGTDVSEAKPDPSVFLAAAHALRIDPANCVVLEDAAAGIEGARNAGCTVIGIGDASVLLKAAIVVPTLAAVPWETFFGKVF